MGKGYNRIKKIADELGWPKSFRRDVTFHDRKYLGDYDGEFLWSVSSGGTHVQRADLLCKRAENPRGSTHVGGAWRDLADRRIFGDERIYHCTGSGCREITQRKSEAVMDLLRGWLDGCDAPSWRKSQALSGLGRRRRQYRR